METNKRPLFARIKHGPIWSVSTEDCDWLTLESGMLCIHPPSGARAKGRDRQQAFMRMHETDEFEKWHKAEDARQRKIQGISEE